MNERAALRLSAAAALLIGVLGLTVALLSGSGAILLDGLFNLCFFATALLTLRVATLVERPDDERYPFGYIFFEPLINTVKGLLILGISALALFDAIVALASGGRPVELGPAVAYAAVATAVCALVVLALRRAQRSPLIAADIENWTVNAAISAGVLAGFLLAAALLRADRPGAAAYIDPAMVALVILFSLAVPVNMAVRGILALLNRAPRPAVVAEMEAAVHGALGDLPVKRLWVRAVQPGRTTYCSVHVLVPAGTPLDLSRADAIRGRIIPALAAQYAPVVVDVVFTATESYAAPTAGFMA